MKGTVTNQNGATIPATGVGKEVVIKFDKNN
jgi:hypothetical protein